MYTAIHSRYCIHRLYVSRKEWGKGLASIEDSMDASKPGVEENIKKAKKD